MAALANPLAYSELVAYARENGMDVEATVTLVQELDGVWLEAQAKKAERLRKKKGEPEEE